LALPDGADETRRISGRVRIKCAWYKSRCYSFTVNSISDGAARVTEPLVPCQ
jgi:hypothetical protein